MLGRWFKRSNRLEAADPNTRREALQALTEEQAAECQPLLEQMAANEPDSGIRHGVYAWVQNTDVLATQLDLPEHAAAAAAVIAARIPANEQPAYARHPQVVKAQIAQAPDMDTLLPLLTTAELASEAAISKRDQQRDQVLALPVLSTESGLSTLAKTAKGRDKQCHRYAKQKLESIKEARQALQAASDRLTEIDASVNKALKTEPEEITALISHRHRLIKLQQLRTDAVAALEQAQGTFNIASSTDAGVTLPADPFQEIDLSIPDPNDNPYIELAEALQELVTRMQAGAPIDEIRDTMHVTTEHWLTAADKLMPDQQQHSLFERTTKQFKRYQGAWEKLTKAVPALAETDVDEPGEESPAQRTQQWLKQWARPIQAVVWPEDHALPEQLVLLRTQLEQHQEAKQSLQSQAKALRDELTTHVKAAQTSVEEGQLEDAKKHLRAAREIQKQGFHNQDKTLAALSAQVAEFSDWQTFATNPKREALLDELKKLVDEPREPPLQAEHLKELREQWRALGKPNNKDEAKQLRQFDEWAEQAFATCKSYFAEQASQRDENLKQRIVLCDQLSSYLDSTDWASADMQAAENIMRTARDAWREHHPCDRRALKPVQQRFESLQDQLHSKVKASWEANIALKQDIVDAAKAAAETPDEDPIGKVKNLQHQWKQVGRTPRGADQRLWREFRKHCDAVFEQRQIENQAAKEAQDQRYEALEAAIATIAQAASGPNISKKGFTELDNALTAAAKDLNVKGKLKSQMDDAIAAYQQALANEQREQAKAELIQWQQWDEAVSTSERTGEAIESPDAIFNGRLNGDGIQENLLTLTLEAEIAADIASPSVDQAARMALQVELMNAGKRNLAAESYRNLLKRWCAAGPKNSSELPDVDALRERFFQALAARVD